MTDSPLEQFVEDLQEELAPDGWSVRIEPAAQPTDASLAILHPLVPGGGTILTDRRATLPQFARRCIDGWREIRLVHAALVRPERRVLIRGLREASEWPNGDGAPDAVRSVGYLLCDQGILTEDEARWLDEAVEPDPVMDPRLLRRT